MSETINDPISLPPLDSRMDHDHHHVDAYSEQATTPRPANDNEDNDPANQAATSTPSKADQDANSDSNQTPQYTATTSSIRRNANGSVSSVYSGNKIRHLKKEDGVPLWRKDIQFDFLKHVFEDDHRVFHKASDKTACHTFADIYLDAMAQSSKCSKILKDKLLTDRPAAVNMAMVCLLVNVGRMNTTLNFFPEMRAQLRTYHSIPSLQLQSHQDPNAYKQLQDAPRLKSILKGATEDVEQPSTIEDIRTAQIPRTNPVNLIFVLAQFAPKISEKHFDAPRDFFDLVMKEQLSSKSRAVAFLWLMWWYLESDFSAHAALHNPFGPGRHTNSTDEDDFLPLLCPQFDYLTDEQAALENVDSQEEVEFGEQKQQERAAIIRNDMAPVYTGPKRNKKFLSNPIFSVNTQNHNNNGANSTTTTNNEYGNTSPNHEGMKDQRKPKSSSSKPRLDGDSDSDSDQTIPASSPLQMSLPAVIPKAARFPKIKEYARPAADSIISLPPLPPPLLPPPPSHTIQAQATAPKRSRPQSHHQIALEQYRRDRVNRILKRGLRATFKQAAKRRTKYSAVALAIRRLSKCPEGYDSEEEEHATAAGKVGTAQFGVVMAGFEQVDSEPCDYGEYMVAIAHGFRVLGRQLARFEGGDEAEWAEDHSRDKLDDNSDKI